jgi:Holliday junction resolvase RusA-like endonuclease
MGPIMLTITYFYDSISMDVDNLPKPISDALRGLVYLDDE